MKFVKMHSCGNDYVYFEQGDLKKEDLPALAVKLSDRRKGIGSDGIICLKKRSGGITMRIFNADGSEGKTCGNGLRCSAFFAKKHMGFSGNKINVFTKSGLSPVIIEDLGEFTSVATAKMGKPYIFRPSFEMRAALKETELFLNERDVFAVNTGNEHVVFFSGLPLSVAVKHIEKTGLFPDGVNIECASVTQNGLKVEVFERGSGKTLACGSGAVASAYAAVISGRAKENEFLNVFMPGGTLQVKIINGEAFLKGETTEVFKGEYEI